MMRRGRVTQYSYDFDSQICLAATSAMGRELSLGR